MYSDAPGKAVLESNDMTSVVTNKEANCLISYTARYKSEQMGDISTITVKAGNAKELSLYPEEDCYELKGNNLKNINISGYDGADQRLDLNITNNTNNSVMITEKTNTIYVSADSDGDGNYDDVIASQLIKEKSPIVIPTPTITPTIAPTIAPIQTPSATPEPQITVAPTVTPVVTATPAAPVTSTKPDPVAPSRVKNPVAKAKIDKNNRIDILLDWKKA